VGGRYVVGRVGDFGLCFADSDDSGSWTGRLSDNLFPFLEAKDSGRTGPGSGLCGCDITAAVSVDPNLSTGTGRIGLSGVPEPRTASTRARSTDDRWLSCFSISSRDNPVQLQRRNLFVENGRCHLRPVFSSTGCSDHQSD